MDDKSTFRQGGTSNSPRFDAELVVHRDPKTLLATNVAFRCLH
jgi:hypothetical protein